MTQPVRRPMRYDAEVNRARIIEFARDTFTRTPDATLKSIARGASVGQGTMYRHFPTRDHLLLSVYDHDVQELAKAATTLSEQHEPRTALRLWLERLAAYGGQDTAAARAVQAATRPVTGGAHHMLVRNAVDRLLKACVAARLLRDDVNAQEVLLLMSYVWNEGTEGDRQKCYGTALNVIMDGLAAPADTDPHSVG